MNADFGLFLRAVWGKRGGWRTGNCGGEESPPSKVGGKGRSIIEGRLRPSLSFLDGLWGGVDFFGLIEQDFKKKKFKTKPGTHFMHRFHVDVTTNTQIQIKTSYNKVYIPLSSNSAPFLFFVGW